MSESTVMILMGLLTLLGLTALGLGFVVLVTRGGSFRLRLSGVGVEVESSMDSDGEGEDSESEDEDSEVEHDDD